MKTGPAEVRHAIRGTLNALKLCVSAFDMPLDTSEKLEFLSDIEASADKLVSLLDRYEAHFPAAPIATPAESSAATPMASVPAFKAAGT